MHSLVHLSTHVYGFHISVKVYCELVHCCMALCDISSSTKQEELALHDQWFSVESIQVLACVCAGTAMVCLLHDGPALQNAW